MRQLDDRIRHDDSSCIVAQDSNNSEVFYIGMINVKVWLGDPATTSEADRKPNASVHLHQDEPVWSIKRVETIGGSACTQYIKSYVRNATGRSWTAVWSQRELLEYR